MEIGILKKISWKWNFEKLNFESYLEMEVCFGKLKLIQKINKIIMIIIIIKWRIKREWKWIGRVEKIVGERKNEQITKKLVWWWNGWKLSNPLFSFFNKLATGIVNS